MDHNHAAMRSFIQSLPDMNGVKAVLDIGCGSGGDLEQLSRKAAYPVRFVGIDTSPSQIDKAKARNLGERFEFVVADVSQGLPYADQSFDLVLSVNVLECIVDKERLLTEVHRVLKPGGQVVFAHFDWDSQLINGMDKALFRKVVQSYNDWQQDWMDACDGWMGRRLWGCFHKSGLFDGRIHAYVMTNTEHAESYYGYQRIQDFQALVRHGFITPEEHERFTTEVEQLAASGEYFYSITMYAYAGRRRESGWLG